MMNAADNALEFDGFGVPPPKAGWMWNTVARRGQYRHLYARHRLPDRRNHAARPGERGSTSVDFEMPNCGIGILLGFAALEVVTGRFSNGGVDLERCRARRHTSVVLPLVVLPVIFAAAPWLAEQLVPESEGWLAHLPAWLMFGILLLADDLTQYWWHRLSHSSWLYPLHRAHHSGRYLSIRVVYRNHLVYYLLMPGIWLSAILVYWGFGAAYGIYVVLKMSVIIGAHSSVPWDAPLYERFPRLMWVVERVISTPATHSAHHGLSADDGITLQESFGNLLFVGRAVRDRAHHPKRPTEFGIEHLEPVRLIDELVWFAPAVRTVDPSTANTPAQS